MDTSHHDGHEHTAVSTHREGFPWKDIIGLVLSLALTFASLHIVLTHALPLGELITAIVVLAVFQLFVQLFLFMHLTEKTGTRSNIGALAFGLFVAFTIVAGSIWIMAFNSTAS
ncbi:cytochrome aa3 quinol oxidase subunit IV [Ferroacidibacillus organovorans]|uniref:Quinol oxidase subunit 4 n=1 Tax=Ferroacidibacillus organovorans TaxID=1765683 RepID=A0A101XR14_9BACL|nr:cytochrome aa3 quinol oxidase subunit IV [Ferroacidibacillus organovorans]KUO95957.1 hypothetical protein ATW55_02435 [Ferroacidibacillus organovorans]